jgi:Protein of unknown function (DUF3224)
MRTFAAALCALFAVACTEIKPITIDLSHPESTAAEPATSGKARGTFDVKLTPETANRMSIDKHYHGDLEATGTGEMLSAMTATKGSAGYVAMEQVSGTLAGRTGSFVLQHSGTMNRGAQKLSVSVVPDSGTGQLAGLTGKMTIEIAADGTHSYVFDYALR